MPPHAGAISSAVSESLEITDNTAAMSYTTFAMPKFGLKVLSTSGGLGNTPLGRLRPGFAEALGLAGSLRLKGLDLLHLSYAITLKEEGYLIKGFLATNKEFTKAQSTLKQIGIDLRYIGDWSSPCHGRNSRPI